MKQKLMSSIGGCLLLAFLLLVFPIRGQAADSITVTDDDNGVKVQYELSKRGDSAGTYSAAISLRYFTSIHFGHYSSVYCILGLF